MQTAYGATRLTNSWSTGRFSGLRADAATATAHGSPSVMKAARIPQKLQPWFEARKKYRLTHAQVQMARELGLNPKKFGGLANHRQEPWKVPLPNFIEEIYLKRFGVERPAEIISLEEIFARDQAKKERKREVKRQQLAQCSEQSAKQEEPSLGSTVPNKAIQRTVQQRRFARLFPAHAGVRHLWNQALGANCLWSYAPYQFMVHS